MNEVVSVIIVKQPNNVGYVATLRFTDPLLDEIISSSSKYIIYSRIEGILRRKTGVDNW